MRRYEAEVHRVPLGTPRPGARGAESRVLDLQSIHLPAAAHGAAVPPRRHVGPKGIAVVLFLRDVLYGNDIRLLLILLEYLNHDAEPLTSVQRS